MIGQEDEKTIRKMSIKNDAARFNVTRKQYGDV